MGRPCRHPQAARREGQSILCNSIRPQKLHRQSGRHPAHQALCHKKGVVNNRIAETITDLQEQPNKAPSASSVTIGPSQENPSMEWDLGNDRPHEPVMDDVRPTHQRQPETIIINMDANFDVASKQQAYTGATRRKQALTI